MSQLARSLADIHIRAPTRGNRRLEQLLEAVNADEQVKAWWHVAGVNAAAPGADRPLLGPHPDRHEHRAASRAAAVPARDRAEHGRRPRHDRARRGGRDRGRRAVPLRRHVDPPHRPRDLLAVPHRRQARRPAERHLRRARALGRGGRGDARGDLAPLDGQAADRRGHDRPRRRRARHGQGPLARRVRGRAAWTSTRSRPTRSTRSASRPATTRRCASRSRCPTPRASSRSTRAWARSCAARRWPSTSRSSPAIEAEQEKRLVPVFRI